VRQNTPPRTELPNVALSDGPLWQLEFGNSPLVAVAIHDGHSTRKEVADLLAVGEAERLHEEDPYTGIWTSVAPTRIIGLRSRFEFDLNRPRQRAVYLKPDDAWGLQVWKTGPPSDVIRRSLFEYDAFYDHVRVTLQTLVSRFGHLAVFDLHSYNYRRQGIDAPVDSPKDNPEVNLGTGTMNRDRWASVVDRFIEEMRGFDFLGRGLDVRENVKFTGGHFSRWIHETFPDSVCSLAIEVKKFFMDEWTGEADQAALHGMGAALRSAATGVLEELGRM